MNRSSPKIARLVTLTLTARVIVTLDATHEQTITAAKEKIKHQLDVGFDVVSVVPDTEHPFDAWTDYDELSSTGTKKKTRESARAAAVRDWIQDWYNLWPRVKQQSTGKFIAGDVASVEQKMKWFVDNYTFSKEQIIEATKQYLQHHYRQGWQHVRRAIYFIYWQDENKIRESDLAAWCAAPGQQTETYTSRLTKAIN